MLHNNDLHIYNLSYLVYIIHEFNIILRVRLHNSVICINLKQEIYTNTHLKLLVVVKINDTPLKLIF